VAKRLAKGLEGLVDFALQRLRVGQGIGNPDRRRQGPSEPYSPFRLSADISSRINQSLRWLTAAGWGSTLIVSLFAAAVLVLVAFVAIEHTAKDPMLPVRFFALRAFTGVQLTAFVIPGAVYAVLLGARAVVPWVAALVAARHDEHGDRRAPERTG
jgi:hypothetical protein